MKCRGCGKELDVNKPQKIYHFMGLALCQECVEKHKPIALNPEQKIGVLCQKG